MPRWTSLPVEILIHIFQFIQSAKQLGECRLVHKTWDNPAESAMLGQEITLHNCTAFRRLINHLEKKPAKGKLVRYLNLDFPYVDMDRHSLKHAFELFFTPHLQVLKGQMLSQNSDMVYQIIWDIVENSRQNFHRLIYLGNTRSTTSTYWRTVSLFKQSLQRLDLQFTDCDDITGVNNRHLTHDVALEIGRFTQLQHLDLQMFYDDSIVDMERILDNCNALHHLRVAISMNHSESLEDYFQVNQIRKIDNAMSLVLYTDPGESPILLEYCTTKYPHIQRIVYESPDGPPGFAEDLESFSRELEILNSVPHYEMEFSLHPENSIDDIRSTLTTDKNDVVIEILDDAYFPVSDGAKEPLPIEIIHKIINFVDSAKTLGECRLVHTSWNRFAEDAMFSRPVVVKDTEALKKLYRHLEKKPEKVKLIKHLHLDYIYNEGFLAQALQLIFTPTLEILEGVMLSDEHDDGYRDMINIIQSIDDDFHLKYISNGRRASDLYLDVVHFFKHSLERMDLSFHDDNCCEEDNTHLVSEAITEVGQFKKLNHLDLEMYYDYSLGDMERLLDRCNHLQHLRASVRVKQRASLSLQFGSADRIRKINSLRSLVLGADPGVVPILLEFCKTKYPNIQRIVYEPLKNLPTFSKDNAGFLKELDMLRSVPYFEMKLKVKESSSIADIRETFKTENNNVEIDILENRVPGKRLLKVLVKVTLS
ncbi:hypothetical protein MBANPS3_001796 [Mucor bainieri]